ncbi:MAG: ribbon-helix-helix domain-containing protein [Candidatus Thorarchaeota archaeon]
MKKFYFGCRQIESSFHGGLGFLQKVTFRLPKRLIGLVDELVRRGLFDSRSEVVRMALMWEKKGKKS